MGREAALRRGSRRRACLSRRARAPGVTRPARASLNLKIRPLQRFRRGGKAVAALGLTWPQQPRRRSAGRTGATGAGEPDDAGNRLDRRGTAA